MSFLFILGLEMAGSEPGFIMTEETRGVHGRTLDLWLSFSFLLFPKSFRWISWGRGSGMCNPFSGDKVSL